jgi:GTP-binding protein HflX
VLIHVIDASHPAWEEQREIVEDVLNELGAGDRPVIQAFNKVDRLDQTSVEALRQRMSELGPGCVFISALKPGGIEPLREALRAQLHERRPVVELRLPITDGSLLAAVHRAGEVLQQQQVDHSLVIRARLDEAAVGRLTRAGAIREASSK